ncbi:CLK4-associating serine/arginine rich protein, partial [Asbolus verrucosus]
NMWHEARRQERKIRGMLVDYRRRAERRRDFYEKIKADPTQFLQIHGRQCKIHLDPSIAAAADSASAMMPWQGQADNLIDRFDVRAHLDYIPPVKKEEEEELTFEERQINYERYRIIAQNSFLAINEEKFLKQLHLEEQFGYTESKSKKEQRSGGVTIGFNYEDNTAQTLGPDMNNDDDTDGNSDSDLDVDLSINVSKMDSVQAHEMNRHGRNFGMSSNDFYSFLTNDLEEAESFRLAKEEEHEKALFSGRKSRRERRAHREKRLANRVISPPSYAARTSPTYPSFRKSKSPSKSPSPENTGKITYITSFGDEEESPSTSKPNYSDRTKQGRNRRRNSSSERVVYRSKRSYSKDRSYKRRRSRSRDSRSRSNTKRRSWSRDRYKKSRSRSKGLSRSYRRKRSSSSSSISSTSTSTSSSKSRSRSVSPKFRKKMSPSSRSNSPPSRKSSKSKSKSPPMKKESPPKVIPRYYGRKKSDQSSSELSDSSVKDVEMKVANSPVNSEKWSGYGNSGNVTKKTGQNLSIQERLKRKRQALLNKQFKADKIAEQLKTEREKQEQQHREDELREMAIKLRRRQREKRHAYDSNKSSSSSDSDSSKSKSPPPTVENKLKSPSPHVSRRDDYRESRRFDRRDNSREKRDHSRDRRASRSPRRCTEKRTVYRERRERRRDDYERDRDYKRDSYDRDRDRREERSSRALVDY